MSAIPSSPVSSVLQSGAAQKEAAREIGTARSADAEASRRSTSGPDAFLEIEATDADTQVHTDSGGLGGQGRQDAPPEESPPIAEEAEGLTVDESGRAHLDLSA